VQGEGVIYLKLFNVVMDALGESFLRRAVYVESRTLAEFLGRFSDEFWRECKGIHRNGQAITKDGLFHDLSASERWVQYSIH
jgi:allantoicase